MNFSMNKETVFVRNVTEKSIGKPNATYDHVVKGISPIRVWAAPGTRSQLHNVTRKLRDIMWKGFSFFTFFIAFPRGAARRRDTELRWKRGCPDVTRRTVITRTSRASESFQLKPGDVSICVAAGTYHLSNENDGSCAKGPLRARAARRQLKKKRSNCRIYSNACDFEQIECTNSGICSAKLPWKHVRILKILFKSVSDSFSTNTTHLRFHAYTRCIFIQQRIEI